jgi:hypothetical protein
VAFAHETSSTEATGDGLHLCCGLLARGTSALSRLRHAASPD